MQRKKILIIAVELLFFPGCGSLSALFLAGSAVAFPVGFDIGAVIEKGGVGYPAAQQRLQ